MAGTDLQARELALRERQIALDERKLAENRRGAALDWIKSLGLPIASLVASIAVFLVQVQQQSFERTLNSIREGYKTYFDRVSPIQFKSYDDFYAAKRALQMTTQIYPEVFCGARDDLVARILNSSMEVDRAPLVEEINELPAPNLVSGLDSPRWIKLAWLEPKPPSCTHLPKAAPAAFDVGPAAAPAAPADVAGKAATGAAIEENDARVGPPGGGGGDMTPTRTYRVFVQIGPTRDKATIETLREDAATLGFRFAAGVETIRRPFRTPEVRYFGAEQAGDAAALAKFMTARFAAETLVFEPRPIGKIFPNLPQDTMEVWVPDAVGGLAAPDKRLRLRPSGQ